MYAKKPLYVDIDFISDLYLNKMLSLPSISKLTNVSTSTIRLRLINSGVKLRSNAEGIRLIKDRSWNLGKKRTFTDEWKRNMSKSRLKYWEQKAVGVSLKQNGYYEITRGKNKSRMLHCVIYEGHYGVKINPNEVVHHINEIKTDNRIENLMLMTRAEHSRIHALSKQRNRDVNGRFLSNKTKL